MSPEFKVIILAIFDENDFAHKAMTDIHGKPMIQHVFDCAKDSGATEIVIATDNALVGMTAEDFGATVCMLIDEELTGISRLAEVVDMMGWDDDTIVVNCPGDAPLTPSSLISQVAENLIDKTEADCASLYTMVPYDVAAQKDTTNIIVDNAGYVMYMSRQPIPHQSAETSCEPRYRSDIEVNAYRTSLLRNYRQLPESELDECEGIEPLKMLFHGTKIFAAEAGNVIGHRVITPEDIEIVKLQIAPGV